MAWAAETSDQVVMRVKRVLNDVNPEVTALPYWTYFELLNRALTHIHAELGPLVPAGVNTTTGFTETLSFGDGEGERPLSDITVEFDLTTVARVTIINDEIGRSPRRTTWDEIQALQLSHPNEKSNNPEQWAVQSIGGVPSQIAIWPFSDGSVDLLVSLVPLMYSTQIGYHLNSTTGPNVSSFAVASQKAIADALADELTEQAAIAMPADHRQRLGIDQLRIEKLSMNAQRSMQHATDAALALYYSRTIEMRRP